MSAPTEARRGLLLDVLRRRIQHGYPGDEEVAVALDVIAELSGEDAVSDAYWAKWSRANGSLGEAW